MVYDTLPTVAASAGTQAPTRTLPRTVVLASGAALIALGLLAAAFHGSATAPTDSSTELYTAAGFEVVKYYKCIFPTCTDAWCNANCNHHPKYCPPSFCRLEEKKVPVAPAPTPPPAPTPEPTASADTCPAGSILGTSWYTTERVLASAPTALICCPDKCGGCGGPGCGSFGSSNGMSAEDSFQECCAQGIMTHHDEECSSTG